MRHTCIVATALLLLSGCAARTPEYGIFFGSSPQGAAVDLERVNEHHLDRAFAAAAAAVGVAPSPAAAHGIVLELHQGAITWESQAYAGTTVETTSRVVLYPCVFEPRSALIHEFVHAVLYTTQGDTDPDHTSAAWRQVEGQRTALETALCPPR